MPRVSVIVPTYNCARFLGAALESVLAQTYADLEILVVDDGSTDATPAVMEAFAGRVRYLRQANRGVSAARNLGLAQAGGELIAYLDADDRWVPHKLERQLAFLEAHPECGLLHSDVTIIDEEDRVLRHRFNRETGRPLPMGRCLLALLHRCHIQTPTVLERREWTARVAGFDPRVQGTEDYLRWIRLAMAGIQVGYLDEPLALYRWRAGSLSSSPRRHWEELAKLFRLLLTEDGLEVRCGATPAAVAQERLYRLEMDLAYLDRREGRGPAARRRLLRLIGARPLRPGLYRELVKACLPAGLFPPAARAAEERA